MKTHTLLFSFLFIAYSFAYSCVTENACTKVSIFCLKDVRLLDSPFKHAENLDKQYLLELNVDRLLAPFMREAGLMPKAETYTNWENTGLDGHIGGHYVSALSLMYASTSDVDIKARLDYMLTELKRVQDANNNGYIGGIPGGNAMWKEIKAGNVQASAFGLNGKWVPLYNIHKTYAGLRDAYLYADSDLAKEMLVKMSDWMLDVTDSLSDDQMQDMLRSEYGGLNETFADVAAITGDAKYMKMAERFSQLVLLHPLIKHEDKLTGMHANTQIPKVIGFKRIADLVDKEEWADASRFFWETVVEQRSVCIGGNSVNEHFHPSNDFTRMITNIEGPETCNTYNMLRLTKMLYQTSLEEKYMDYYERALYNHILSSQHPETGGLVYFTQMRPGHYRVYSQPHTSMWCCVGSGIENHAKYGEIIYAHTDNELYVNLFIPSQLSWKEKAVEIIQENNFPIESRTTLTINPQKTISFTLKLRYPTWVEKGTLKVIVNGKEIPVDKQQTGYINIERKWKKGDKVVMEMPMHITAERLSDTSNYYAYFYGPIVLAAKTGTEDLKGLFADDSRGGHIAHGRQIPLQDMPIVVSEPEDMASQLLPVSGKPFTFSFSSIYPESARNLELIPFYQIHDSRYAIYWAQATTAGLKEIQTQIEAEEKERIALNSITIDRVTCGEQQPESDHFIRTDDSWIGSYEGVAWRESRGFFSYELRNTHKTAKNLYLKYFDHDKNRNLVVYINETEVFASKMNAANNKQEQVTIVEIPANEQTKEILIVKFASANRAITNKMTEVRILK